MPLKDLAEYLKMSDRPLYGYAQKGLLSGIKIGSARLFRKADIDA
jgi:excisionase family DNA binding protein